jgi:hypothetical protein
MEYRNRQAQDSGKQAFGHRHTFRRSSFPHRPPLCCAFRTIVVVVYTAFQVMFKFHELMEAHQDELADVVVRVCGRCVNRRDLVPMLSWFPWTV